MCYNFCGTGSTAVGVEGDFGQEGERGVGEIEGWGVGEEFNPIDADARRGSRGEHERVGKGGIGVSGCDIGEPDEAAVGVSSQYAFVCESCSAI